MTTSPPALIQWWSTFDLQACRDNAARAMGCTGVSPVAFARAAEWFDTAVEVMDASGGREVDNSARWWFFRAFVIATGVEES